MSTYSQASQLKAQLTGIINEAIENHPLVKSAIKAKKAVVQVAPNTTTKTVKVKFLPDLFNDEIQPLEFSYNPNIPLSDMAVGKTVFIFYYQTINNGVIMQNASWSI